MKKGLITRRVVVYGASIVTSLCILFQFFVMLSTSLKPKAEVFHIPPYWIAHKIHFLNYIEMWRIAPLTRYFLNSIIVAGGATILAIGVAIPAAYALSRLRFTGRRTFLYLVLITQMFSPIVIIIGLYRTMAVFGMLNTYQSLIITFAAFNQAFSVWLLTGYFSTIPIEIEEAALIDGCSRIKALRWVLFPLSAPGIVATIIFVFIWAWNEFMIALTFTSTPEMRLLTVGLFRFMGRYEIQWHYLMGASLLATIPVLVLFLTIQNKLVQGLTAGAIK
ncbi:Diacetylchitobiose uptake system permease protein DasC [subsurface metagenome]